MHTLLLQLLLGSLLMAGAQTAQTGHGAVHGTAERSATLTVTANGKTSRFSTADLASMPQRTVTVHNGRNNAEEHYSGVLLSDVLGRFGVTLQSEGARMVYHSYLRVTGTDGYFVLFSASEAEPGMHTGDILVATSEDGKALESDGAFKLVCSEDKRPARWVRNLKEITLTTVE